MNNESVKCQRLGRNPLASISSEEAGNTANVIKENLINYNSEAKCVHLSYSVDYKQHYCVSHRSRQKGPLGQNWQEKCRKCHVKEEKPEELEKLKEAYKYY